MPVKSKTRNVLLGVAVVAAVAVIGYVVYTEVVAPKQMAPAVEMTMPVEQTMTTQQVAMEEQMPEVAPVVEAPVEQFNDMHMHKEGFENPTASQAATGAMPGSVTTAADLLPANGDNMHAQVNPNGQGDILGSSLLTAGYHTGINTVGTSLRNANRQLRSEPANPQVKVSPWNQTTIDPDMNKRNFEIGN